MGEVPEWTKGTDCKSVAGRLRRFESSPPHQFLCGNSSAVERQPSKLDVAGSNPVSRSNFSPVFWGRALVAQLAEHILGKDEVTGSIPVKGSNSDKRSILLLAGIPESRCRKLLNSSWFYGGMNVQNEI